jgi:hypothetical protein
MQILPAKMEDILSLVRLVNNAYRGEGGWTSESHLIAGRFGKLKQPLELVVLEKAV